MHAEDYAKWLVPNYAPADFLPERAEGSTVYDNNGKDYIDFAGGIAVMALGHSHPEIVATLEEQARKVWHISNYFTTPQALTLAKALCEQTFAERVYFCNSGSEANETAIKMARRWQFQQGRPEQNRIIAFEGAFHGRSMMNIALGAKEPHREGFGPIPEGVLRATFNDPDAHKMVDDRVAAVFVEPVQGESGVFPGEPAFLQSLRDACDKHNALLIFDEVQSGMGRTGNLFAYMGYGITPDILTSAKALGSGFPIGATLARAEIAEVLQPGTHGTTYGGNPLACAVAHRTLQLVQEALPGVAQRSQRFKEELESLIDNRKMFSEIRISGMLMGMQLTPEWSGRAMEIVQHGWSKGVLFLVGGDNDVLRFTPALNISDAELEEGLSRFRATLSDF